MQETKILPPKTFLAQEKDYPYKAKNGQCSFTKQRSHSATITGHKNVAQNNEKQLQVRLPVHTQPLNRPLLEPLRCSPLPKPRI